MNTIKGFIIFLLMLFCASVYAQSDNCLTTYGSNFDDLLSPELVTEYSKGMELDHYITGAGTKYVESQYFWYPDDETTYFVKLYNVRKETSENPIERFKARVQKKSDEVYSYELAENIGDYAFWTRSNMEADSEPTTDASLKVLSNKESFVIQVDMGDYAKSQEVARQLASEVLKKCG